LNLIDILFMIFAFVAFSSALLVVFIQDLFKSALMLVVTFISIGCIFFLLNAEFLGVVQILIYVGGISIIIIFAVLMTKDMAKANTSNIFMFINGPICLFFFIILAYFLINEPWYLLDLNNISYGDQAIDLFSNTTKHLATLLLKNWVIAFEFSSVLLLAVIIGSLALVKDKIE
jgi:NADH-quinone oxidoreductase subunit J